MNGFTTWSRDVSRMLGRAALCGGLLCSAAGTTRVLADPVQFSSGFESSPIEGASCPTYPCPPQWGSGAPSSSSMMPPQYPTGPQYPGTPQYPGSGMSPGASSSPQNGPMPSLPQADPSSVVPAPFTAGSQPTQTTQAGISQASFTPGGLSSATAPTPVSPNMIGDFFGAISSDPIILPGNLVQQAILFTPILPGTVDYYRGVDSLGQNQFQTNAFVYLGNPSGGLPTSVNPSALPPQLLQEYNDGGVFSGDPNDLLGPPGGFLTNAGPFIALDSGSTGEVAVLPPETPGVRLDEPLYDIYEALLVYAPTPGSGGGVGRQKIAENTSPIPRDRVFINHSTFTGVPFTSGGMSVYRFAPGIEKAFHEQRASIEVRLPFASTIDSDISAGSGPVERSTEFGNIVTTLKALVRQTPTSALAVGVSMTAPTAQDLNIDVNGTPMLAIENESFHVMPYIGGTNLRGRFFSQWYLQGDIDTTGSPVDIRNVMTGQIEDAGTLHDAPMLYASVSGGYWLFQNGSRAVSFDSSPGRSVKRTVYTGGGGITGLAPIMEFHFNRSLDKSEVISSGPIEFRTASDFSVSNLVLGGMMTYGTGGSLTVAWGTPIIGQDDKQFDNEIRVLLNHEF